MEQTKFTVGFTISAIKTLPYQDTTCSAKRFSLRLYLVLNTIIDYSTTQDFNPR